MFLSKKSSLGSEGIPGGISFAPVKQDGILGSVTGAARKRNGHNNLCMGRSMAPPLQHAPVIQYRYINIQNKIVPACI